MKYVPKQLERTADVSRGKGNRWEALVQGAQAFVALAVLYAALGYAADFIAERIPSRWEAQIVGSGQGSTDDPSLQRPQQVLDKLLVTGDIRPLPYRLTLIDHDSPNAFAFPGGMIGITSGLLDKVSSEPGLAMVLGHEIGHHHRRHVLKRLGRVFLIVAPVAALSGEAGRLIVDFLNLRELAYSREQEREADRIGLELVAATYDTVDGALEFFEVILAEQGSDGPWSGLAASHPPTQERLDALRLQATELNSPRRSIRD